MAGLIVLLLEPWEPEPETVLGLLLYGILRTDWGRVRRFESFESIVCWSWWFNGEV